MPWVTITEADVLTVLSGPELTAYRAAALAAGQDDPVAATITQVTNLVRGYVGACRQNTLEEGEKIPDVLLPTALDLLAVRIPRRVRRENPRAKADAENDALELLRQVAKCEFAIPAAVTETTEVIAGQKPASEGKCLKYTRRDQEGL